jgi:hypothetical protein
LRTEIALKFHSINTAAVHLKYELQLYIAALNFSKTMKKLELAIAIAAGFGTFLPRRVVGLI